MSESILLKSNIEGLAAPRRGKVRDIYETDDCLLIVATDRVSAFDVVLGEGVQGKGRVLTQVSRFWFEKLRKIVPHHLISTDVKDFPPIFQSASDDLDGRSMLVKKAEPLPVECIVRGYLAGSGWQEYRASRSVCGIALPDGLRESDKLPEAIFTPSTKAPEGEHDENISFGEVEKLIGGPLATQVKEISLELYSAAHAYAETKGFFLADTKFEFGECDGQLILIDEAFTPDSSRFWSKEKYVPGSSQDSYDKQIIRNYLLSLGWDRNPPPPSLPQKIIDQAASRYQEIYERLTR